MAEPREVGGMRARVRLVAVDVDGTLLDADHHVGAANAAAVRAARGSGVRVVLVSARPPVALRCVLDELDAAPPGAPAAATADELGPEFVAAQGALTGALRSDGRLVVLARHPMPAALARACAAEVPPGISVQWYARDSWLVEQVDALVDEEARIVRANPTVAPFATAEDPDKLLLLAPAGRTDLLDLVALPGGLTGVRSTPTHLEVTASGVDKVHALGALAAGWGIASTEVAAIGDGPNDLPMLRFAGIAVAPANAAAEVRAAADLVVASNDRGAVAQALGLLLA